MKLTVSNSLAWLGFALFVAVSVGMEKEGLSETRLEDWGFYRKTIVASSWTMVYLVGFVALIHYSLKPIVTSTVGKERRFFSYLISSFGSGYLLYRLATSNYGTVGKFIHWGDMTREQVGDYVVECFVIAWISSFVVTVWQGWQNSFPEKERLENEARANKLEALTQEVEVLRREAVLAQYQLDPHHLANELNDLYLMVLQNNPRAAESLRLLAHFMRMMISKQSKGLVPLERELELLQSYIDYERYSHDLKATVIENTLSEEVKTTFLLPGGLTIPMAENMFKYGQIEDGDPPNIKIFTTGNNLTLSMRNRINSERNTQVTKGGTGQANLKTILDIFLPGSKLVAQQKGNHFQATLTIPTPTL